jgi:hypothetical protein
MMINTEQVLTQVVNTSIAAPRLPSVTIQGQAQQTKVESPA